MILTVAPATPGILHQVRVAQVASFMPKSSINATWMEGDILVEEPDTLQECKLFLGEWWLLRGMG